MTSADGNNCDPTKGTCFGHEFYSLRGGSRWVGHRAPLGDYSTPGTSPENSNWDMLGQMAEAYRAIELATAVQAR